MNERVGIITEDWVSIIGDYYEGGRDRAVLLLHMMPATRASWTAFANALVADGLSVLAVDLRGHGESTTGPNGTLLDYQNFKDEDHQASIQDVEAASQFLKNEKKMKEISIAGASIGANLALVYAAAHPEIRSLIILSPGLDYRGVLTKDAAVKLHTGQQVFFMASEDDEYSAASTKELFEVATSDKKMEILHDAGHGTTMLERKPEYLKILADWLYQTGS
ncbi:MAG: alpha/beta fold hydrolase [Candidatus Sungbacteria bacterium]|nr:alpha/beta fold hydrolase [Candidatus Sungbacteria bacterium]